MLYLPIDHSKIYIGEECPELIDAASDFDFNSIKGLIHYKILPPPDTPVLRRWQIVVHIVGVVGKRSRKLSIHNLA